MDKQTINVYWTQIKYPNLCQYFYLHLAMATDFQKNKSFSPFACSFFLLSNPITYNDIITNWASLPVEFNIYKKVTMGNNEYWALEIELVYSNNDPDDIHRTFNITSIKQSSLDQIILPANYQDIYPNLYLISDIDDIIMAHWMPLSLYCYK